VESPSLTEVVVYDTAGRLARSWLVAPSRGASGYLEWKGTDAGGMRLPAGAYVVAVRAGGRTEARTVLMLK
jgi:hypothetical protein